MENTILIAPRFCGPPNVGNGGYTSGLLAQTVNYAPTITLRKPPLLNKVMQIIRSGELIKLMDGNQVIADVKPGNLEIDIPEMPTLAKAEEAVQYYDGFREHAFPECFVCGPNRTEKDGLRIFSGRIPGSDLVANPWIPDATLADAQGKVKREFIWAALDCPGAYAILEKPPKVVLGRITGQVFKDISVGEQCIVIGWPLGQDGRKYYSGTAIYNEAGQVSAAAKAIWFTI